jgi:hypothetical protein
VGGVAYSSFTSRFGMVWGELRWDDGADGAGPDGDKWEEDELILIGCQC